jgi:hypothetical protein
MMDSLELANAKLRWSASREIFERKTRTFFFRTKNGLRSARLRAAGSPLLSRSHLRRRSKQGVAARAAGQAL